ncbi:MAG: LysM peptidoglycan-binding domain-containing protein [Treponema sp.]|nr:LysM peptidoglycan-binding domain-containing protein [Treponema sp.]
MNHRFYLVLMIAALVGSQPLFAQETAAFDGGFNETDLAILEEAYGLEAPSGAGGTEREQPVVPYRIRNNRYFQASQRFYRLAEGAYNFGDYDSSTAYAEEAIRLAGLSDEYVALQMKMREANSAIAAAKYRIDWAVSSGVSKQYPSDFREAETWYGISLDARVAEEWDNAIDAAYRVVELLAYVGSDRTATGEKVPMQKEGLFPLPATYIVRTWSSFRDCLWNIAAQPWAYGDPFQWEKLYEANKTKLPDPHDPDLIEPGMVINIPSLRGEKREGTWDENKRYPIN